MAVTYSKNGNMKYFPQKVKGKSYNAKSGKSDRVSVHRSGSDMSGYVTVNDGDRMPISVQKFNQDKGLHPTQKPVELFEYLIRTYTNESDVVLDNCIGSGTTAIAALNTKRNFIGIEKEEKYFTVASERINKWYQDKQENINLFSEFE